MYRLNGFREANCFTVVHTKGKMQKVTFEQDCVYYKDVSLIFRVIG